MVENGAFKKTATSPSLPRGRLSWISPGERHRALARAVSSLGLCVCFNSTPPECPVAFIYLNFPRSLTPASNGFGYSIVILPLAPWGSADSLKPPPARTGTRNCSQQLPSRHPDSATILTSPRALWQPPGASEHRKPSSTFFLPPQGRSQEWAGLLETVLEQASRNHPRAPYRLVLSLLGTHLEAAAAALRVVRILWSILLYIWYFQGARVWAPGPAILPMSLALLWILIKIFPMHYELAHWKPSA